MLFVGLRYLKGFWWWDLCVNPYKPIFLEGFMEYTMLLDEAYEKVDPVKQACGCGRFEVMKVSGHHEGSRTIITNFCQVACCIRRDPEHLMKFLVKELASSGNISGDRLILPRKVSSKEVNEKVCKYVEKFVLCPRCKKPDTELANEKGKAFLRCLACGIKQEVHKI